MIQRYDIQCDFGLGTSGQGRKKLVDEKRSKSVVAWDRPSQGGMGVDQDRFQTEEQLWNLNWLTGVCREPER